jgi:signal transduction histidine kinase
MEAAMDSNAIAQWAHDICNTLGTVSLYLESLERSSHADPAIVLTRSDALLKQAASMCSDLMPEAGQKSAAAPRQAFDVAGTIEQVLGLIAPIVPPATTLHLVGSAPVYVVANPKDVFRILFNLVHNAVAAARATGIPRRIELVLEQDDVIVTIRIADDGPGLPQDVRARLFRRTASASSNGYGLSIARELAERNGAFLELSDTDRGTEFTIELPGVRDVRGEAFAMFEAA